MTLLNGHASKSKTWSTLTVRDFFSQISWTGEVAPSPLQNGTAAMAASANPEGLSLRLPVHDFFARFPWDGKPTIAAPTAPLIIQPDLPAPEEITLDDLF